MTRRRNYLVLAISLLAIYAIYGYLSDDRKNQVLDKPAQEPTLVDDIELTPIAQQTLEILEDPALDQEGDQDSLGEGEIYEVEDSGNEPSPSQPAPIGFSRHAIDYQRIYFGLEGVSILNEEISVADLSGLSNLPEGASVELTLPGGFDSLSGTVFRNMTDDSGYQNVRVNFSDQGLPEYVTVHFHKSGMVTGKMYSEAGTFVLDGDLGAVFIIDEQDLHRLEGYPITE